MLKKTPEQHLDEFCKLGLAVVETELAAIAELQYKIDRHFANACQLLLNCKGRIVVIGMGKSGHIANKIAATLASTGSPAFFVHPGEASHGDLGMITPQDIVLALSYSGETEEILCILPLLKRMNIPLIAITGNNHSALALSATIHLNVTVPKEACPLGLAPTASTTAMLVLGDALAIALLEARGFTAEDFALSHPRGSLGKRLLLKVQDVMRTGKELPIVRPDTILSKALIEMTQKSLGLTLVCFDDQVLAGIFTDGDLRRALDAGVDIHQVKIENLMNTHCKTISTSMLAYDAFQIMKDNKITSLAVVDAKKQIEGVLHLHDLLKAGVS